MGTVVIFSPDVGRLASFYERVLDAQPTTESSGDIRLRSEFHEVLVHSMPKKSADQVDRSVPALPRENAAMKPIFEIRSLPDALRLVETHGGVVTDRTFRLEGITRHDVVDPDGNVIQLRDLPEGPA
jgi:predicted enzyme related to lactoylglutathione lyase